MATAERSTRTETRTVTDEIETFTLTLSAAERYDLLSVIERSGHPDLTDHYGRVWTWKGRGDLYSHDNTLCVPVHWVTDGKSGLPDKSLADNPNYSRLCAVCRSEW